MDARWRFGVAVALVTLAVAPAAQAATSRFLIGVTCSAPNACIAVGTDSSDPQASRTLAEAWNGTIWTVMPTPNPPSIGGSNFYSVSCASATACMAVGGTDILHGRKPLAEVWNGAAWTVVATPAPPGGDTYLKSVACTAANACVAVGFAIRNSHNNAFAAAWNGTRWTLKALPRPAGTSYSALDDVSCGSRRACVAVGNYQTGGSAKGRTLAERWNGSAWRISRTPNPPSGGNGVELRGVSCRSARACTAVGGYGRPPGTGSATLVERWNGRTWRVVKSPSPTVGGLSAVACGSASACVAIGFNDSSVLGEAWNGRAWAFAPPLAPPGVAYTTLERVACGSPSACIAVGDYQVDPRGSDETAIAEAWNGSAWTMTAAP